MLLFLFMASSIVFCSGKKEACVGTEEVSSVPLFLFYKPDDGSIKFFNEFFKYTSVNQNPLTANPIFVEYISGKFQSSSLSKNLGVLVESDLYT